MAEELAERVDEQLNCSICLDTYTNPKILQCFHVFCQKCLVKLVVRDQQGQLSLSCPICRQVTPIPAMGTAGLQSAFHINPLLVILDQHKKAKAKSSSAEKADSKTVILSPQTDSALTCSEHGGREVELFCETCQELLCLKCVVKGSKHYSHDYRDISESFERYREQVMPSLEPLEKQLTTCAKMLTQLDRHCEKITDQQAAIEAEIRGSCKQLQELISKRQEELIDQLEDATRRKLKRLATQRDQIETLQAQLSSCLDFTRESLKKGIEQCEVLVMKSKILKQVGELIPASQPDIFTLNAAAADMVFSASADVAAVFENNYGRVYTLDSSDPSKCVATGRGTEEAVVGEKATAVLHVINFKGAPCSDSLVSVELVSEILGHSVEHSVEHRGQGQYVVSYQPTVKGRHQLYIKVDGQHIRGSPLSVPVKLLVEYLGTPILTLRDVGKPWGLAITGKGEMVVAESGADCVSVFSPCGEKLRSFGTHGSGQGQFWGPSGVSVDGEGSLLVTDRTNCRIQKFTTEGQFLKAVSRGALQFNQPCDIAYSASNNKVYVADTYNDCVQILNSDLSSNSMFGRKGSGIGQLDHPFGVTTDSTGRVYVVDSWNHRIQVFTAEGKFLRILGTKGEDRGELNFPFGVAVDASGLVYISELYNHRVSVFTAEGVFVMSFGSKGNGQRQFDCPHGLAVDDSGVVYICDNKNNRIQLF